MKILILGHKILLLGMKVKFKKPYLDLGITAFKLKLMIDVQLKDLSKFSDIYLASKVESKTALNGNYCLKQHSTFY